VASIAAGVLTGLKAGAVPAIVTGSYTEGAKTEESELTILSATTASASWWPRAWIREHLLVGLRQANRLS
jgi:hypothetical protein